MCLIFGDKKKGEKKILRVCILLELRKSQGIEHMVTVSKTDSHKH